MTLAEEMFGISCQKNLALAQRVAEQKEKEQMMIQWHESYTEAFQSLTINDTWVQDIFRSIKEKAKSGKTNHSISLPRNYREDAILSGRFMKLECILIDCGFDVDRITAINNSGDGGSDGEAISVNWDPERPAVYVNSGENG